MTDATTSSADVSRVANAPVHAPGDAPASAFREGPYGVRLADETVQRPRHVGRGMIPFGDRLKHNLLMAADHLMSRKMAERLIAGPRARLLQKIQKNLEAKGPGTLYPIDRRRNLTAKEFHREYLLPGIPVVLEGAAKDWPCVKKWTLDYFAEHFGDDKVTLTSGVPHHSASVEQDYVLMRDVIQNSDPENVKYLRFHPMLALHPELAEDFPYDWFRAHKKRPHLYSHMQFFIGTKGTATGTHNSQMANLFVMVEGEKIWYLHSGRDFTAFMDPPTSRSVYRLSRHNTGQVFEEPYRHIDGYKVHLKPGDVLWNPPFYWHSVQNLSDTIGVGFRWNDKRIAMGQSLTCHLLDWLATDPTWWYMMKVGRDETRRMLGKAPPGRSDRGTPMT